MENIYKHRGTYHDPEDIRNLFPAFPLEGREADAIVAAMFNEGGNFEPDMDGPEEPYSDFVDELERGDARETANGKYIVTFCKGSRELLDKGDWMHGYYIDVWENIGEPTERLDELFKRANELMFEMKDILAALETFCYR